ncbi:DNA-processing protein DprA [Chryseobacterium sp. Hurlbut01]|uniref:DNA-processing protein DprA n=1 Tax=Chryseobacterium sp. Hurlbut01 TaxID=1681828 RepID=UPI001364AC5F|nr:DNA-processing protein DprA [Chryseobacterium sp. Hurlbut01]
MGRVKINNILTQLFVDSNRVKIDINLLIEKFLNEELNGDNTKAYFNVAQIEQKLSQKVHFIDFLSKNYPTSLKPLLSNRPTILSCIGNLDLFEKTKIGFCGSRKATEKGFEIARDISEQVSLKNITVVSGYASGIDLETHYTSLKNNGSTIIVLPEGLENFKIKKILKDVWDWERVLVISEYLPNAIWSVSRAMERNSTIVALSNLMVLIEARIKGGSIDAGIKTLQFEKPLFAPIYEGMPEEASGNQYLLEKGAYPLKRHRETKKANLKNMFEILDYQSGINKTLFD